MTDARERALLRAKEIIEVGDRRLMAADGDCGGLPPDISLAEWNELYQCILAALGEGGEPVEGPADSVQRGRTMEADLKPCPFCGRDPYVHEADFPGADYQIGCDCGDDPERDSEQGAVWRDGRTFEEAAERWNTRALTAEGERGEPVARGVIFPDGDCFRVDEDGNCLEPSWTFVESAEPDGTEGEIPVVLYRDRSGGGE